MLWVDKHRPLTLEKLDYHASLSTRLGKVVQFTAAAPTHALLPPPPVHTDTLTPTLYPRVTNLRLQLGSCLTCSFMVLQEQARRHASWPCCVPSLDQELKR